MLLLPINFVVNILYILLKSKEIKYKNYIHNAISQQVHTICNKSDSPIYLYTKMITMYMGYSDQ